MKMQTSLQLDMKQDDEPLTSSPIKPVKSIPVPKEENSRVSNWLLNLFPRIEDNKESLFLGSP
jgi:hypothetical protein